MNSENPGSDPATIAKFCNSIRQKEDWVTKILDKERDLGKKWAVEAGLRDNDTNELSSSVLAALEYVV